MVSLTAISVADQSRSATGVGGVVIVAALLIVGYLISLRIHPYTACRSCKGKGKRGRVFSYAFGDCGRCGGKGRKLRLGVRAFGDPSRR